MSEIEITSESEVLSASVFEGNKQEIVLIIASATGVKQSYYHKFAQFVASQGITVITFDYTGIGRSLRKSLKTLENNAADWGSKDLESVIQYALENYPKARKVLLGHSIGGQLVGLAKSSEQLDKIILVAAQSGFWKLWNGVGKIRMWFNWYILFPVVLGLFGYLNSKKINGMENLPRGVAKQWSSWSKSPNYLLDDPSIEATHYHKVSVKVTAYSIEDDAYAPKEAVQWITDQFKNATTKSVVIRPIDFQVSKIGHFGVFKDRFSHTIWPKILHEIT